MVCCCLDKEIRNVSYKTITEFTATVKDSYIIQL